MGEGESFKSVYITIQPEEYDVGLERAKRAIRMCLSADLGLPSDAVPWHNAVIDGADAILQKLAASKKKAKEEAAKGGPTEKTLANKLKPKKRVATTHQQLKMDFYKLINVRDPSDGCSGFNVSKTNKMMEQLPSLTTEKYLFTAFAEPITALHMLCAMDAPLSCIKRCLQHNIAAVDDNSSAIGSPLHYACWFRASTKTVRYICTQVDNVEAVLSMPNRSKRTPLHLACLARAHHLVPLLTSAGPAATKVTDKDGMTPLHLALTVEKPALSVIEDLTEVCPEACSVQLPAGKCGSTPLHLAVANPDVGLDILRDLAASHPRALKLLDAAGNTPLHAAVLAAANGVVVGPAVEVELKLLLKRHPQAARVKNGKGETPYKMAKAAKLDKDILRMLKPAPSA